MKFQLTQDYHIHSVLSTCSSDERQSPERILRYAIEEGLSEIVITDHLWDSAVPGANAWYAPQNIAHVKKSLPLPQSDGVKFYFGCETEWRKDYVLGIAKENLDEFDFIVIPTTHLNSDFTMDPAAGVEERAKAYIDRLDRLLDLDLPFRKIGIAHLACGLLSIPGQKGTWKDILDAVPDDEYRRIFARIREKGAGVELNGDDFDFSRKTPDEIASTVRPFAIAKEEGCKFYFGSDAHHPNIFALSKERLSYAVDALGLTEDDKFHI